MNTRIYFLLNLDKFIGLKSMNNKIKYQLHQLHNIS